MLRELALRVASLKAEDRNWLMNQLSKDDQDSFMLLVDEAIAMGLTASSSGLPDKIRKIDIDQELDFFSDEELEKLSLFWANLLNGHQTSGVTKKALPKELMASVIKNARELLSNNIDRLGAN